MFYEHDDKYIPLKIILKDLVGYYNDYKDNSKYDAKYSAKKMNFKLDDDSLDKIYDIYLSISKKDQKLILIILYMRVKVKNILKQLCLMKNAL